MQKKCEPISIINKGRIASTPTQFMQKYFKLSKKSVWAGIYSAVALGTQIASKNNVLEHWGIKGPWDHQSLR